VTQEGEEFHAVISDDGRGSSPGNHGNTSGLSGLSERVAASGGDFEAGSPPEGGFRLRVSLPLQDVANSDEPASEAGGVREDRRR